MKSLGLSYSALIALILGGVGAVGGGAPVPVALPLGPGTSISGTITDESTGLPLDDIYVTIWNSSGAEVSQVSSNSSGDYVVSEDLSTGIYFAETYNWAGYVDELYSDIYCGWFCDQTTGTPISVTEGSDTSGIDFTLRQGGKIAGTITDKSTGLPLEGTEIWFYDSLGRYVDHSWSDSQGKYVNVTGLPNGGYRAVTNGWPNHIAELFDDIECSSGCDVTTGTPIDVIEGSTTPDIDFTLAPFGSIRGRVTDESTGNPIGHARIEVFDSTGSYVGDGRTDSNGSYVALAGDSGTYYARTATNPDTHFGELYDDLFCDGGYCAVTTGTPISVTQGVSTSGIDFALKRKSTLSGTVTDGTTGLPIRHISVSLFVSNGQGVGGRSTDAYGNFEIGIGRLPAGTYYAIATSSGRYLDELYEEIDCWEDCDVTTGTPIEIAPGTDVTGINFTLQPSGTINGTLTDHLTGLPIAYQGVRIHDANGTQIEHGTTNFNGEFSIPIPRPAGIFYAITAYQSYSRYLTELYDDLPCWSDCDVTTGTPIQVVPGADIVGIDLALLPKPTIRGTITDQSSGQPIHSVEVIFFDSSGSMITSTTSDLQGAFVVHLPGSSGTYFAKTSNDWGGYFDELYDDIDCSSGCDVTSGTPIQATPGFDTSGIDFALMPGSSIRGTVSDQSTGLPIEDAWIQIHSANGTLIHMDSVDSNGDFLIYIPKPNSVHYARTLNWAGKIDELFSGIDCSPNCDVTTGTPIQVLPWTEVTGIDFALSTGGSISGTITDQSTGLPLDKAGVSLYTSGGYLASTSFTENDGRYISLRGLLSGSYHAVTYNLSGHRNELFRDLDCLFVCDVTAGEPINVTLGMPTVDIDFSLESGDTVFLSDLETDDLSDWAYSVP